MKQRDRHAPLASAESRPASRPWPIASLRVSSRSGRAEEKAQSTAQRVVALDDALDFAALLRSKPEQISICLTRFSPPVSRQITRCMQRLALELYYGEGCPRVQVVWHRSPENRLEEGAIRRETEFLGFGFRATGPCQLPGSTQATRFWEVARAKVAGAAGGIRKMQWGGAVAGVCAGV